MAQDSHMAVPADSAPQHNASTMTSSSSGNPGPWKPTPDNDAPPPPPAPNHVSLYADLFPGKPKSLSGISFRAFALGLVFASSTILSISLAMFLQDTDKAAVWRAPFFLAALSLFHFLEFFITAAYNTRHATISAFLLSQNGSAYNAAHSLAMLECLVGTLGVHKWHAVFEGAQPVCAGLALMLLGQLTRSLAMAQAGTNFNHTVQMRRIAGHELVTGGVYAFLRHPSYFGFFWWAIGTQVVLGNPVCLCAYAVILWGFFNSRIKKEEELLVSFFGDHYTKYRQKTGVGIPFIA